MGAACDVWIDPVELKGMAQLLTDQSYRIQEAATGTRESCVCAAPRSMVGWIDEALVALTEDALRVAISYVQNAIDIATRANEVVADQAADTTTGTDAGTPVTVTTSADLSAVLAAAGSTIGAPTYAGLPLIGAMAGVGPGVAFAQNLVMDTQNDHIGRLLEDRNGTYNPTTNRTEFDATKFYENKRIEAKAVEDQLRRRES